MCEYSSVVRAFKGGEGLLGEFFFNLPVLHIHVGGTELVERLVQRTVAPILCIFEGVEEVEGRCEAFAWLGRPHFPDQARQLLQTRNALGKTLANLRVREVVGVVEGDGENGRHAVVPFGCLLIDRSVLIAYKKPY